MSSTTLSRLSGISLFVGSLLTIGGSIPNLVTPDAFNTLTVFGSVVNLIGITLIVLGLPGMYLAQAKRAGTLGLIGFILTLCFLLMAGYVGNIIPAFLNPFLADHALLHTPPPVGLGIFLLVGVLLGVVGGILLGVATIRAALLARWAGVLLIAGMGVTFFGNFLSPTIGNTGLLLFLAALAWLGLTLVTARGEERPAPQTDTSAEAHA